MHDEGAFDRQSGQRVGHQRRHVGAERPDHAEWRFGRICERPQNIEYRPYAECLPHRCHDFHRRVEVGSEEERETQRLEARSGSVLIRRQGQAETFEDVGAARFAGDRPVTVLDDRLATCGGDERGTGGQIETSGSVAAGSHDIDAADAVWNGGTLCQLSHGRGKTAHFGGRFSLGAESRQQGPRHRAGKRLVGQCDQQVGRFLLAQVDAAHQALERLVHDDVRSEASRSKKLRSRRSPSGVRTLSG